MSLDDKVYQEVEDLIKVGNEIIKIACQASSKLEQENLMKATMWVTRSGQLIHKLYGKESQLLRQYKTLLEQKDFSLFHSGYFKHASQLVGILMSVKHEIDNGLVSSFKQLIQASIFADFLEMAEYLLEEEYKDASAVLIGGVLEDSLRKLAQENGISTTNSNGRNLTMEPLNIELYKEDVYDKLVKKQITSWGNLRNDAAHGNYGKYDKDQVKMMLAFVQKFTSEYLT